MAPNHGQSAAEGTVAISVHRRGGRSVLTRCAGTAPLRPQILRSGGELVRVALLQSVGGPVGGDRLTLELEVGPGAALEIVVTAATVALPGNGVTHQRLDISVGAHGRLVWLDEPLILARGCRLARQTALRLAEGALALTRETVVLGRSGEPPGELDAQLRCDLAGEPLLRDAIQVLGEGGGHRAPSILGDARAYRSVMLVGAWPPRGDHADAAFLARPGAIARRLGSDCASLARELAETEKRWRSFALGPGAPA